MSKLIILSFLVMGMAFYQLSGGSDFVPRSEAIKARIAAAETDPAESAALETVRRARPVPSRDDVAVSALAASPAVVRTVPKPDATTPEDTAVASTAARFEATTARADSDQVVLASLERGAETFGRVLQIDPQAADSIVEPAEPNLQVAATVATPDETSQPTEVRAEPEQQADLREVTASRVNVRTGPGTDHDILTKVTRGQQVEVLSDNGDGWLRLRILPDDRVGWIAARLISPAG